MKRLLRVFAGLSHSSKIPPIGRQTVFSHCSLPQENNKVLRTTLALLAQAPAVEVYEPHE